MRHINEIIIHATATRPNWRKGQRTSTKVAEVKRWHVGGNGWSDIGYHYLIDRDGTVAKGRPIERTGAHVKGRNSNSIGVAMFGGHGGTASDQFADHFTDDQLDALNRLIADLQKKFPEITQISGHNQYAAKACPCFSVPAWLATGKAAKVAPLVASTPAPRTINLTGALGLLFAFFGGRRK